MNKTVYPNSEERDMPRGKKKVKSIKIPQPPAGLERPNRPEKFTFDEPGSIVQGEFMDYKDKVPTQYGEANILEFIELTEGRPRSIFCNYHLAFQVRDAVKEGMKEGAKIWAARLPDLESTTPGKHPAKQFDFAYANPETGDEEAPF
jgi:hypothetical protein